MSQYPGKGQADFLQLGDFNAVCGQCGRKRKASTMKRLPPGVPGGGLYTCPEHWDFRQPQDFVRGVPDKMAAPWVQPYETQFVNVCTPNGLSAVPGQAVPGCCVPGYLSPAFLPDAE